MLFIKCSEHFEKVVTELQDNPEALKSLMFKLNYLCNFGEKDNWCELYSDFADNSFTFAVYRMVSEERSDFWFNGGLIYNERSNSYSVHT